MTRWTPVVVSLALLLFHGASLAQPANDECSGALIAVVGNNFLDTSTATDSTDAVSDSECPGTALGVVNQDVWFRFDAPDHGTITLSTCETVDFDTDILIYTGGCGALDLHACHGDSPGCLVEGTTNSWNTFLADVPVTSGESYWIRIGGWGGNDFGDGVFSLAFDAGPPPPPPPPPPVDNDECVDASEAFLGDNPLDTTIATDSSDPYDASPGCNALGVMNQDVWFHFTPAVSGALTLSTCNIADFDTDLVIYEGTCGSMVEIACSGDVAGCAIYTSIIETLPVEAGIPLQIRIGGWGNSDSGGGTFSLDLVPSIIDEFSCSSEAGSNSIGVSATLASSCDSIVFTVQGIPALEEFGPFSPGEIVTAQVPVQTIQALVEVCAIPVVSGAQGVSSCCETPVTGPIAFEGCQTDDFPVSDALESVQSPIAFDQNLFIWDLQVEAQVDHPDSGQLRINISSPSGTTVTLHDLPAGGAGGIDVTWWQNGIANGPPFDSGEVMQPSGPGSLHDFQGDADPGNWVLQIDDDVAGGDGTLLGWCLRLFDTAPAPSSGQNLVIGNPNNLVQAGREGDEIGCGTETVICNNGDEPLDWYGNPDYRHPYMIYNMYRLENDRLMQIGGSWVKHGWSSAQANACGFGCDPSPTNQQTGVGCSDTYGAGGNASQNVFGPRSEIDPWTGAYTFDGSWLDTQSGGPHDGVEHRLRLLDQDIDPVQRPDAQLFSEIVILHHADIDHSDNLAWEPITVSGAPGGNWSFNLSAVSTLGPVLNAWPGAQVHLVQPIPNIDGRCYLADKVTDNGDGTWHYEYAIFNLDMSRNVGALSIPVSPDVNISNVSFHAPWAETFDYSNDSWQWSRDDSAITWMTQPHEDGAAANPLRWGFLFNLGFDADSAPESNLATVGVHSPSAIPELFVEVQTPPVAPAAPSAAFSADPTSGDAPLTVQFTDASTGIVEGHEWDFGDGGISSEANPTYTYTDSGTFTVTLTVSNSGGSDASICSDCIAVAEPPPTFIRGGCNGDGTWDIGDPIYLLGYLFQAAEIPSCFDACDANDDGMVDIGDGISMLTGLFGGGPTPPAPWPDCGPDPTDGDALDSVSSEQCNQG